MSGGEGMRAPAKAPPAMVAVALLAVATCVCVGVLVARSHQAAGELHLEPPRDVLALLQCPPGGFLKGLARDRAAHALRAHWRGLRRSGYVSQAAQPGVEAHARGFLAYEDAVWPKPPWCRNFWHSNAKRSKGRRKRTPRVLPVRPSPPGTCEPNGTECDKWRISHSYRFIWHHVWKAGTTSLSPYLSCNFDALPVANLLPRLGGPMPGYLHVGTAREPMGRFVSGFQEVFFRALGAPESRCQHRGVPWLRAAIQAASASAGSARCPIDVLSDSDVRRVFEQFVVDVSCGVRFANSDHMLSQVLFLGANTTIPIPLDLLLHLETLAQDLDILKQRVGYSLHDHCPLGRERSKLDKPLSVPSQRKVRHALSLDADILQGVCDILMIDYICLGYSLPAECMVERRG